MRTFEPRRLSRVAVPILWLLLSAIVSPTAPQTVLRESSQPGEIQIVHRVTLGDADGPGFLGYPNDVEQRLNGEWVATDGNNPTEVKFFSPSGEWIRTVGREGEGPGEFSYAWVIHVLPNDGLAILDAFQRRLTTFGPDLRVASISTIPVSPVSVAFVGDSGIVVCAQSSHPEQVGLPLHLVAADGTLRRSFGADPPIRDWGNHDKVSRSVAPAGPDEVWVGFKTEYRIERWNLSGTRTATFAREVPWFQPHDDIGLPRDRSLPPNPSILALRQDSAGRLWVAIRIPDEHWEEAFEPGRDPYGRERPMVKDWNRYYDTMLEVIDPRTGTVVAAKRHPRAAWGLTRDGHLITHVFSEEGTPFVEVLEARLTQGKGG